MSTSAGAMERGPGGEEYMTISVDFNDPSIHAAPYDTYAWLLREHPVSWEGRRGRVGGYEDNGALLGAPRLAPRSVDKVNGGEARARVYRLTADRVV